MVLGCWPVSDRFEFCGVHRNSFGRDDEAEVFDGVGVEGGLLELGVELVVSEALQDHSDVLAMFFGVSGEYEDIIEIDDHELVRHVSEYVVHEVLERRRRV